MDSEQIIIHVEAKAARAFKSASSQDRRKMEALLSIRLSEITSSPGSLKAIMSEISQKAEGRGLIPDVLRSILNENN